MEDLRFAVVGIGAAGTVLAADLLIITEVCFKDALDVWPRPCVMICQQNAHGTDFLGAKIVEYGRQKGITDPLLCDHDQLGQDHGGRLFTRDLINQ